MSVNSLEIKVQKMHREAAAMKASAAVRVYIEDNPTFVGPEKLHIVSFKGDSLDGLNKEEMLDVTCLCALQHKGVQKHAKALIKTNYGNLRVHFEVTDKEAHVVINKD